MKIITHSLACLLACLLPCSQVGLNVNLAGEGKAECVRTTCCVYLIDDLSSLGFTSYLLRARIVLINITQMCKKKLFKILSCVCFFLFLCFFVFLQTLHMWNLRFNNSPIRVF